MKKGFTLIELLAVIVILAIIALIATPIVLNIINDTKSSATLRSADFYLDALELSIARSVLKSQNISDGTYNILENGNICLEYENTICTDELVVEVNGEVPSSGKVRITKGNITDVNLKSNDKTIVKNKNGELVYLALDAVCTLQEGSTSNTIGAKYSCDFGGGTRNFYILELGTNPVTGSTLEKDEVALILEGNYDTTTQYWCLGGELSNTCAADGLTPKLDEIAEVWLKLEREQIGLPSAVQVATADGKVYTDSPAISNTNAWLYNWPGNDGYNNGTSAPYGYWTSTPFATMYDEAHIVEFNGYVSAYCCGTNCSDIKYGVRPVITLKL